jgi:hypothetical protein
LNLPSADVVSFTGIQSSQNPLDFVSFTNTFGALTFNFTTIGNGSIGINGGSNDSLNSFSFQETVGGTVSALG